MRPKFALSLSFQGIGLLRRSAAGWVQVADVALNAADLDAEITALRQRALTLSPDGDKVTLVLPNEQIRYLRLSDPGEDEADRKAAAEAALDGATPYEIDELVYDTAADDGTLYVAAVARETLEEAEGFTEARGFQPVSFTAMPAEGDFPIAVFFGAAQGWTGPEPKRPAVPMRAAAAPAAGLIAAASSAVSVAAAQPPAEPADLPPLPQADPATDVPDMELGASGPTPLPDTAPEAALSPLAEDGAPDAAKDAPDARTLPETDPEDVTPNPPEPAAEVAADPASIPPDAAEPILPVQPENETETSQPVTDLATPVTDLARPAATTAAEPDPLPESVAEPMAEPAAVPDEAALEHPAPETAQPPAQDTAAEEGGDTPGAADSSPGPDTAAPAPVPPMPVFQHASADAAPKLGAAPTEAPKPPSFSSIRATRGTGDAAAKPGAPTRKTPLFTREKTTSVTAPALDPETAPAADGKGSVTSKAKGFFSRRRSDSASAETAPQAEVTPIPAAPRPEPAAPKPAPPPPLAANPDRAPPGTPTPQAAARIAALRRNADTPEAPPQPPIPSTAPGRKPQPAQPRPAPADERERMTVFGARGEAAIGGKPRYLGLMLTAALLLFLAGVAAWASVFLDNGLSRFFNSDAPETELATLPADPELADSEPEPEVEDTRVAALDPTGTTSSDAGAQPLPAISQPAPREAMSAEQAAATYAATGIWQRAPASPAEPPQTSTDGIYVASIDPGVPQLDAVALPALASARSDETLQPVALPWGPDVRFDLDERGLVRATPEGAISPDGVRVFTGLPPQVPPLRSPGAAAPDTAAPGQDQTQDAERQRLQESRPKARPGDLVEKTERATLGGNSLAELAQKRPAMRPLSAQERFAAAQQAARTPEPEADPQPQSPDVSGAIAEAAAAAAAQPVVPRGTAQAVARSLEPLPRPRNMASIVQRAQRQQQRQEVQVASAGPVRIQPGPKVPQNANVARQATVKNQINLRRVSLIGVFGKPSSRRALVRLPNGNYKKVKVGDRIDGGRVSAIGEADLRYTKGGRSVTLKLPRG